MARAQKVSRPQKRLEFEIRFATSHASVGWRDLCGTQRNKVTDAWDFLTRHPLQHTPTNHPLKGELGTITRDGRAFDQWQHELSGGARIWFYVDEHQVHLVKVHTNHPNETK